MQLIGNAMLIQYTKINKKGITRMQLLITFGLKDLAFAVWDMLQGSAFGTGKIDVEISSST
jgi:hypothetical protein